jgi:hypothetical protein
MHFVMIIDKDIVQSQGKWTNLSNAWLIDEGLID